MDPVTALGLTASLIAIGTLSIKTTQLLRQALKSASGLTEENTALQNQAQLLRSRIESLSLADTNPASHVATAPSNALSTVASEGLAKLCKEGRDTVRLLLNELEQIKILSTDTKLTKLRKVSHTLVVKRKYIKSLEVKFRQIQQTLTDTIVVDVRELCQKAITGHVNGFSELDKGQKAIIHDLALSKTDFKGYVHDTLQETNRLIIDSAATSLNETVGTRQAVNDLASKVDLDKFIESLSFPGMFDRENMLDPAAEGTYRWIFDMDDLNEPHRRIKSWSSFPEFLTGDAPTYWVSGKAGSGKSTLLNYIWTQRYKDTRDLLQQWTGERNLIMVAVFFWNSGTLLQRSTVGLLRSLLYQILKACRELARTLLINQDHAPNASNPWNEFNLRCALAAVMKQSSHRFWLLIDGLDEYEDASIPANIKLVKLFGDLFKMPAQQGRLKCCLSSRPLKAFEDVLYRGSMLRMQDLTKEDMKQYLTTHLGEGLMRKLYQDVLRKAEGIFLWVKLCVNALLQTYTGDIEELQERLHDMPVGFEALLDDMLHRISDKRQAALLFRMLGIRAGMPNESRRQITIGDVLFAISPSYAERCLKDWRSISYIEELNRACKLTARQVTDSTAGLLVVEFGAHNPYDRPESCSEAHKLCYQNLFNSAVAVFHRAVEEHLSGRGRWVFDQAMDDKQYFSRLTKARLTRFKTIASLDPENSGTFKRIGMELVLDLMHLAQTLEQISGHSDPQLMQAINSTARSIIGAEFLEIVRHSNPSVIFRTYLGTNLYVSEKPVFPRTFDQWCASYGLVQYVFERVSIIKSGLDSAKEISEILLRAIVAPAALEAWSILDTRVLHMIKVLLEAGADPNIEIEYLKHVDDTTSAWKVLLMVIAIMTLTCDSHIGLAIYSHASSNGRIMMDKFWSKLSTKILPMFMDRGCSIYGTHTFNLPVYATFNQSWCLTLEAQPSFLLQFLDFKSGDKSARIHELTLMRSPFATLDLEDHSKPLSIVRLTQAGSEYLLEALISFWHTHPWASPPRIFLLREVSRRLRHVSRSAYGENLFDPPLGYFLKNSTVDSSPLEKCLFMHSRDERFNCRNFAEYREGNFTESDCKDDWDVSDEDVISEDEDAWTSEDSQDLWSPSLHLSETSAEFASKSDLRRSWSPSRQLSENSAGSASQSDRSTSAIRSLRVSEDMMSQPYPRNHKLRPAHRVRNRYRRQQIRSPKSRATDVSLSAITTMASDWESTASDD